MQKCRAWNLVGLGVRYAYTLALHLVNTTPTMTDWEREFEVRVWHSLCSVERLLCILTGRPSAIQDRFISARLPRAVEPYFTQSNPFGASLGAHGAPAPVSLGSTTQSTKVSVAAPGETFIASLHLDAIIAEALTDLYSSSTVNTT